MLGQKLAHAANYSSTCACSGLMHGMAVCRGWATQLELPPNDMNYASSVIKARMALEQT